ncbi:hypothetical protein GKZ75_13275 [Kocuria indica]|uniref:Uncharacterized protein n=1 Tax=Kocuria marina subsp. indica TaxID=1049583 RepID=A0A6N9R1T0_9MICC|nr:hypothetical protein [Kocuria indica]
MTTWVARYRAEGAVGLKDRPSRPHTTPSQLDPQLIARIEDLRRERKWSARRIHHHLRTEGHQLRLRTVGRWLYRPGLKRPGFRSEVRAPRARSPRGQCKQPRPRPGSGTPVVRGAEPCFTSGPSPTSRSPPQ